MNRLLIVEDDDVLRETLARAFRRRDWMVHTAADGAAAMAVVETADVDGCVLDLRLAAASGLDLVSPLLARQPAMRILILTGYSSIATAVDAIKRGAVNYLAKPASLDDIVRALQGEMSPVDAPVVASPSVERLAWEHIQRVLLEEGGNISSTARRLGMHRRTLQRRLLKRPVSQ